MSIYTFGTFAHTYLDNGGAPIAAGSSGDTLTFTVRSLADAARFGEAATSSGTVFYIWWDNEILKVTVGGAGVLNWTAIRGQFGTTATAHADGSPIRETVPGLVFSSFLQGGGFTGEISAPDLRLTGITGAASSYRLMSATSSGAPTSGTFLTNDVVLDLTNHEWWLCTAGGSPGTWVAMGGGGGGGGSSAFSWSTKTANYTITTSDSGIAVDASGGNITITLPTAVGATQFYAIKRIDASANTVTIATTGGQSIDGFSTIPLVAQDQSVVLASTNANWLIEASFYPNPDTARGDLTVTNAAGALARLGVGANKAVLTSNGTDPGYAALDLSYLGQSSAATGQVAQWNGTAWVPATISAGSTSTRISMQSASAAPPVPLWNSDGTDYVYLSTGTP
jgi:hypothetical protein